MKTAVLQLARLGDIFQTWPVLRALKRMDPTGELHLVTRSKFASAAPGSPVIDRHWKLETREILAPLIEEHPDLDMSFDRLTEFCDELRAQGFDRIINLSFSPFSSYMTREIAGPSCDVRGYTRFDDGYLSIPDDGSAYFYAQVGPSRSNRLHVTDLFAYVAGVELSKEDWFAPPVTEDAESETVQEAGDNAVVIHIGASDAGKTFGWSKWLQIVRGLLEAHDGNVVLIGTKEERETSERIASVSGSNAPINLVGRTNLTELVEIIRNARLLVGGDSGPVQIASLTGTPVLNVSFPMVSFWETGPRSAGSRILSVDSQDAVPSDLIVREAMSMLNDEGAVLPVVRVTGPLFPYIETTSGGAFGWEMVKALYMGEAFPPPPNELFLQGASRLQEVNQVALEQISAIRKNPANKAAASILDRVDEIMEQIIRMVPELSTIVQWFRTERLRIGPMQVERLVESTGRVHMRLGEILSLYCEQTESVQEGVGAGGGSGHDDIVLG